MVDFTSLDTATLSTVNRFHDFAKNIETAHLGNLYTTVIDGIDYYVVECIAKPVLAKAPEWVSDNRVVSSIQNNKGFAILAGSIITIIFIVIMLHPKGEGPKPTPPDATNKIPSHSDDEGDSNTEKTDGKGKVAKTTDPVSTNKTPSHSDDEGDRLEEDSDVASGEKNISDGSLHAVPKTINTAVNEAEIVGKDDTTLTITDEIGGDEIDSPRLLGATGIEYKSIDSNEESI